MDWLWSLLSSSCLRVDGYSAPSFSFRALINSLGERSLSKRDTVGEVIKQLASDELFWHTWVPCSVPKYSVRNTNSVRIANSSARRLGKWNSCSTVGQEYSENSIGTLALFPNLVLLFPNYAQLFSCLLFIQLCRHNPPNPNSHSHTRFHYHTQYN